MNNLFFYFFKFIKLSYSISKKFLFFIVFDIFLNFLYVFVTINLVKNSSIFFNNISFSNFYSLIFTFLIIFLILSILKIFIKWKIQFLSKNYILKMEEKILEKSMKIQYNILESKEFHDLYEKVRFSLRNQYCIENLIEAISNFVQNFSIIFGFVFYLTYIEKFFGIILIIFLSFGFINKYIYSNLENDFYENLSYSNRKYWYYSMMIFKKNEILDVKSNDAISFMDKKFKESNTEILNFFLPFFKRQFHSETIKNFISITITVLVILYSYYKVFNSSLSFFEFNVVIVAIFKIISSLEKLSESLIDLIRYTKYSKYVIDFILLEQENKNSNFKKVDGFLLEGKNVNFGYEDGKNILKDISFNVTKPKFILILGENGSGKSTLIKLFSGLYKLKNNNITFSKEDIYNLNVSSVIFQDFNLISDITIRENIACKLLKEKEEILNVDKKIDKILKKYSIDNLKNIDLDSKLGSEIDENNIDLSGGQSQFVAILRSIYKESKILILDEPQSFLDIENENLLYNILFKLKKEKIIFLVSHKLNAVKYSDEIWFMEKGKIIEKGNHEYLYKNLKSYRDLYDIENNRYKKLKDNN